MHAPAQDPLAGLWQGYDGELSYVSRQLLSLAEAVPASLYAWRPAPGVRSFAEAVNHITLANFYLLAITGPPLPADLNAATIDADVTEKPDVIAWLRRSLDAVRDARPTAALQAPVKVLGRDAIADGIYLRILVHLNEHMGQLVAYARMNAIAPPWAGQ